MKKLIALALIVGLLSSFVPFGTAEAFLEEGDFISEPAGFLWGIWHGLLAPYSLIARLLIDDVIMYSTLNTGWFYDAGFLLGVACSGPVGWIAAIIATVGHIIN